jgi:acid phosphatase
MSQPARLTRRALIAGTAGLAALPATAAPRPLSFVVVGDWGREGASQQRAVGVQMGGTAADIASRFVISVGDNFYENGVTGLDDPQWRESFEDIYPAASLQTPWHVILGNHDYRGDVAAQIAYSARSPRWRMPARHFRRTETLPDGTQADFFYIDTSPFISAYRGSKVRIDGQDTEAQLAWLDAALGASTAPWKIVVGHHPVFTVTGRHRDTPELIARLKPLLDRHGVPVYLNGHDHNLQHIAVDGVHYITSGAGSKTSKVPDAVPAGQFATDRHGFMTVALSRDAFTFGFVDDGGAKLYGASVPRNG